MPEVFRPKRPRSAFARTPAAPAGGGVGRGAPQRTTQGYAGGGGGARPPRAPGAVPTAWQREEQKEALREMCVHLKRTANALSEENMKVRARMMAVERELGRRDKLLRELVNTNRDGHGLRIGLLEKLREERNLLPIFKRKCVSLGKELEDREKAIYDLKREPRFTRIVELETELQPWVSEIRRLDALMRAPSVELNAVAKAEVENHQKRAEVTCKLDLEEIEKLRRRAATELQDTEAEHQEVLSDFLDKEAEMKRVDLNARELAQEFKLMVEQVAGREELRRHMQQLEMEKEECARRIGETKERIQELMRETSRQLGVSHTALAKVQRDSHHHGNEEWLSEMFALPPAQAGRGEGLGHSACPELRFWEKLARRMRILGRGCNFQLFERLQAADTDGDGVLQVEELAGVFAAPGLSLDPKDFSSESAGAEGWAPLLQQMIPGTPGLSPEPAGGSGGSAAEGADPTGSAPKTGGVRWLDLLILFDRLGSPSGEEEVGGRSQPGKRSQPLGPSGARSAEGGGLVSKDLLLRLRSRCLSREIPAEDLRRSMAKLRSVEELRALFGGKLGLGEAEVDYLADLYEQKGPTGLLLRVPMSEAGLPQNKREALTRKFAKAVRKHQDELQEGFGIWGNPARLTPEQFRTVCLDVLAHELSAQEVEDMKELCLPPSDEEFIDGLKVLKAAVGSSSEAPLSA